MYCSILFLTSICIDRYLAIVQVEASRRWRSPAVAKCVCVFIWLFAIVVTYSLLSTAFKQDACCLSKLFALTVFEFFLPLLVIAVFTVRIACWSSFTRDMPHHVIVYHITVTLSSLNSCLDPVVYCFVTNNFQGAVKSVFRRAEVEQTSGDVVSMQRSSKGSGTATAIAHSMIMLNLTSPLSSSMHA
ncbi:hypothetical protein SKAU_G00217990 [Synaphobranchus kaupii]|uniref:G-protein coupled receptors family 1 profile domain-containing protein n=1 Tax=Synaphobranchus kaupii TaxID=118154 RepID=A0A9Q1FAH2_SYNKA|nr:hypothetical protein SKAU_G00217990 [Synaphobranchus kaupii]